MPFSFLDSLTLELIQETKLWRLLPGCDAGSRLEASGVLAHDGHFHVIFDNLSTIACIDANLAVTPDNCMVGRPDGICGFEDITYNDREQRYYTLVEAMPHVAVSDRMKPGEQHAKCEKTDQSIHIFRLPQIAG